MKEKEKGRKEQKGEEQKGDAFILTMGKKWKREKGHRELLLGRVPHGTAWHAAILLSLRHLRRVGGVNSCQDLPAVAVWHDLAGDLLDLCGGVAVWRHNQTRDGTPWHDGTREARRSFTGSLSQPAEFPTSLVRGLI